MTTHVPPAAVLDVLRGRSMTTGQILRALPDPLAKYGAVRHRLRAMEREGSLAKARVGRDVIWSVKT